MKNQYKIEEEVRKTMVSWDELGRVEGNPFLFTRIQARLEEDSKTSSFRFIGALQLALVVILLVVNVVSLSLKATSSFGEEKIIESIASDYGIQPSEGIYNYYDQN